MRRLDLARTSWFRRSRPIYFRGTLVLGTHGAIASSLRVEKGRVDTLDSAPAKADYICDLGGSLTVPGLINAHDHLEFDSFAPLKWRDCYSNVREWIADFQPRFGRDPVLTAGLALPLEARLLQGGLKNLISGATTVCHHNPMHPVLRRNFPVRVLKRYRFNHSLHIDGDKVAQGYERTPAGWPWIIHAAEGTDKEACEEIGRLERLGCLGPKTLLVHGVALTKEHTERLVERGCALVWCPASNLFLLGATAPIECLLRARRLALGTDSRLSGSRDLLEEMRIALMTNLIDARILFRTVTADAATILGIPRAGTFSSGCHADLVVVPNLGGDPYESVVTADRASLRLVMVGGRPAIGDRDMRPVFEASGVDAFPIMLDGRPKLLDLALANRIKQSGIHEPGLDLGG